MHYVEISNTECALRISFELNFPHYEMSSVFELLWTNNFDLIYGSINQFVETFLT